jgi:hypothetical protein
LFPAKGKKTPLRIRKRLPKLSLHAAIAVQQSLFTDHAGDDFLILPLTMPETIYFSATQVRKRKTV